MDLEGYIPRGHKGSVQPDPELLKELDKNGPIKGPDVLPHGGGAVRPSVKLD